MEIKKSNKQIASNKKIPGPSKIKFEDSDEDDYKMEEEDEEVPSEEEDEDDEPQSDEDEDQSSDEEEDLEQVIKRELGDIPLGELHQARSDGFHAINNKGKKEKKVGRANKNRPMEISSKKPVGRYREVIQVPKKARRDPRFESLCGDFDNDGFRKRYDFLFAEKEKLQNSMKKSKDPKVTADLKDDISSLDKHLKAGPAKRPGAHILQNHKKNERELAKQGKRPYYLKPSEVKKQSLIEQFHSLKASGKLNSFMEKRRKKNASRDHRFMPYRRPGNDDQPE